MRRPAHTDCGGNKPGNGLGILLICYVLLILTVVAYAWARAVM